MRFQVTVDGEHRFFADRLSAEAHLRRLLARGAEVYILIDTQTGAVLREGFEGSPEARTIRTAPQGSTLLGS